MPRLLSIYFSASARGVAADVWDVHAPEGRGSRLHVAHYDLPLPLVRPTAQALLAALTERLDGRADYWV